MLTTERFFIIILLSAMLMLLVGRASASNDEYTRSVIQQRIAPVGQVKIAPTTTTTKTTITSTQAITVNNNPAENSGEAIYKSNCSVCHATGLAGAPKFADKAAWQERAKKGINSLVESAIKGLNAMPPRGTCTTCTDDQLKQAIEYMLPKK